MIEAVGHCSPDAADRTADVGTGADAVDERLHAEQVRLCQKHWDRAAVAYADLGVAQLEDEAPPLLPVKGLGSGGAVPWGDAVQYLGEVPVGS